MKILQINNHHRFLGGAERYYIDLSKLLTKKGHKIAFFSTKNPENLKTLWSKYFIEEVDFENNQIGNLIRNLSNVFYSFSAKRKLGQLLDDFKPDIVHIHNIYYYISPSILGEIKKRGIPIVQTVHDYQLISPNLNLFAKGKIIENPEGNLLFKTIKNKEIKNSFTASVVAAISFLTQHQFRFYEKTVSVFITPSLFTKNKFNEYGFKAKKIINIPNFVNSNESIRPPKETKLGKYVLYFGRLSEHKGILDLLEAIKRLPQIKFKLVGTFSDKAAETKIKKYLDSKTNRNLGILNHQNPKNLKKIIRNCTFTVVPSKWYENQPYSILESYSLAKPVIASEIGGVPEIVDNGKTGFLFKPGDIEDLTNKIEKLWKNPKLTNKLGKNAKYLLNNKYNPGIHYQKIIKIYKSLSHNEKK